MGSLPPSPRPGDPAPSAVALDTRGDPVALEKFWRGGSLVLVFLRHWG